MHPYTGQGLPGLAPRGAETLRAQPGGGRRAARYVRTLNESLSRMFVYILNHCVRVVMVGSIVVFEYLVETRRPLTDARFVDPVTTTGYPGFLLHV